MNERELAQEVIDILMKAAHNLLGMAMEINEAIALEPIHEEADK